MSDRKEFGAVCARWWGHLTNREIGQSRAELAQLRRASVPFDVLSNRASHRLHAALAKVGYDLRHDPERLALIAMTLAQVKEGRGLRLAQRMGQGDPATVSALRFDRLIKSQTPAELAPLLRRALAQVGHQANAPALACDLMWWHETTRARWCFEYYGAADAAPDTEMSTEISTKTSIEETGA